MNGLASNGAMAAYAKLIGASSSAAFLMERCPVQKIKTKNQGDLLKLWLGWGDERPTGVGRELLILLPVYRFSLDQHRCAVFTGNSPVTSRYRQCLGCILDLK